MSNWSEWMAKKTPLFTGNQYAVWMEQRRQVLGSEERRAYINAFVYLVDVRTLHRYREVDVMIHGLTRCLMIEGIECL